MIVVFFTFSKKDIKIFCVETLWKLLETKNQQIQQPFFIAIFATTLPSENLIILLTQIARNIKKMLKWKLLETNFQQIQQIQQK